MSFSLAVLIMIWLTFMSAYSPDETGLKCSDAVFVCPLVSTLELVGLNLLNSVQKLTGIIAIK
jgi:hypothetical protein